MGSVSYCWRGGLVPAKVSSMSIERACKKCGETKNITEFGTVRRNKDGLSNVCKICKNKKGKEIYWANPERARAKIRALERRSPRREKKLAWARADRAAKPEKYRARTKADRAKYPERQAGYRLKHRYNMTLEEREFMVIAQGGLCLICKLEKKLVVDHKKNGSVRGLLCDACNKGLGCYYDTAAYCYAAGAYLEKFATGAV